jgi:putative PIG3 family NAD(P)H quinone oxidoreductase
VPEGASEVLGLEVAGEVVRCGEAVTQHQPGDRVMALLSGGGYAEHALAHEAHAMPLPGTLSYEQAAAIPEAFLTAFQALRWHARAEAGEVVLIHAGASGVGTAAIQLARLIGVRPFVTASAKKHAICRGLGALGAIDYRSEDFAERLPELAEANADVVLDFIGAGYFAQNLAVLARDGRLVVLGLMGGAVADEAHLGHVLRKRLTIIGSTLRSRSDDYKARLVADFSAEALPQFGEGGALVPVVDSVVPWSEVRAAHERMEANLNVGKIVLSLPG